MRTLLTATVLVSALVSAGCDDAKKPDAPRTTPSGSSSVAATPTASASATAATPIAATTAPTPSATASAPPIAEGPALVIVAMKFVAQPPNPSSPPVELHADGTIHVGGKLQGKIAGARFEDKDGKVQGYVDKDGKLASIDKPASADQGGFNDKDELVMKEKGSEVKFVVADDGTVSVTHDGKTEKLPLKIEGFKPTARRVAALMAMLSVGALGAGGATPSPHATPHVTATAITAPHPTTAPRPPPPPG